MLQVLICEDNAVYREKFKNVVEDIILKENIDLKISLCTENPMEIIEYIKRRDITGIYFLDVDLKCSMNGIKLGEKIRDFDPRGFIIFTTVHTEMSYMVFKYKVEAMDYVAKDEENFTDRVKDCLLKAYRNYYRESSNGKYISINEDCRIINIKLGDILFIETSTAAHRIRVHEENRQIEFYGSLKDIQKKLTSNFYRCHKSYIVNRDKIAEVDMKSNRITMTNGEKCYVSFRYKGGLKR